MKTLTDEWIECFNNDRSEGKRLADSIFWRLAVHTLPEGVDAADQRVIDAIQEIKKSIAES